MKNIGFLHDKNIGNIKIGHLRGNYIDYKSNVQLFDFYELRKLIKFFSTVESKFKNAKLIYNIVYNKRVEFADKLTYILLECLLYDQIINRNNNIRLYLQYKSTIKTEGIKDSIIFHTRNEEEFKKKFFNNISAYHYRKLVNFSNYNNKPEIISIVLSDLRAFLTNCEVEQTQSNQLAEISVELIDNALEHSQSDCLFDIDVTESTYRQEDENTGEYMAVNIAVIDFSPNTLGLGIKNSVNDNNCNIEPYKKLIGIKEIHENYFNSDYNNDQFYLLSTFQNKISSRIDSGLTGGKGLTKLIEGLQKVSKTDICYVVSNDICLVFKKEHIKQDADKWVGFNEENDCKLPPMKESLLKSPVNIIGTAYNLTFVLKRSNKND